MPVETVTYTGVGCAKLPAPTGIQETESCTVGKRISFP